MNKPGHVSALPDGYSLHQDFINGANSLSIYQPTGNLPASFGDGNNFAPSYGHSMIPGLGLGAANTLVCTPGLGSNEAATSWQAQSQISALNTQTKPVSRPVKIPGLDGGRGNISEDGEVSDDGELEDVYEPTASHQQAITLGQGQPQTSTAASHVLDDTTQHLTSERDGSYSPHLSPQELLRSNKVVYQSQNDSGAAKFDTGNQRSRSLSRNALHHLSQQPSTVLHERDQPSHSRLEDAKKQAKDAILHLWPMDIRFRNFVAEGIDRTVLKSLFGDLGLNTDETSQTPHAANATTSVTEAETSEPAVEEAEVNKSKESVPAPKDKSEERKDRIARLLAAKGSKQGVSTIAAPQVQMLVSLADDQSQTQTQATKSAKSSMSQMEKSKLIQQKLAALKKAREIPQRPKAMQIESHDSGQSDSSLERTKVVDAASRSESIPGLFLSPSKTSVENNKAMTELGSIRQEVTPRQPFDQNPESRPFLINVSDDEEDEGEEMEIDSPICPQTPASMLGTPARHDAPLDEVFTPCESAISRRVQSPASTSIPLRTNSRNNGDLESMNKKIEEMKRKIAEAEARKKAKDSRKGSPALSQRCDSSLDVNLDVAHGPEAHGKPCYGDLALGPKPSPSPALRRRSRSRAASERLPLLEARRREQLEKLRTLQFEVARIEMELEKDKLEQERLKEEIMNCDSDKDDELPPVVDEDLTGEGVESARPCDEMDMAEELSPKTSSEGQQTGFAGHEQQSQSSDKSLAVDAPISNVIATVENKTKSGNVANVSISTTTTAAAAADASDGSASGKMDKSQYDGTAAVEASDKDVVMEDTDYAADEDVDAGSEDDYEPPDVTPAPDVTPSRLTGDDAVPAVEQVKAGTQPPPANKTNPSGQSVASETTSAKTPWTSFVPYETPLRYFHAYRFHPSFKQSVAGGLRSLTYSNKIDVKKELCPDELAGQSCPRDSDCDYQHFGTIQTPDDQILLQLGAAEHYDEQQRDEYISGLKQLLTDYRTRKVRDFDVISQGIVDYRARFLGDKTKILPLGHVTL